MKARNAGEAKWAKRQARSHIDQRKREAHKTRVGYVHNNQKREFKAANSRSFIDLADFRDPLREHSCWKAIRLTCSSVNVAGNRYRFLSDAIFIPQHSWQSIYIAEVRSIEDPRRCIHTAATVVRLIALAVSTAYCKFL